MKPFYRLCLGVFLSSAVVSAIFIVLASLVAFP